MQLASSRTQLERFSTALAAPVQQIRTLRLAAMPRQNAHATVVTVDLVEGHVRYVQEAKSPCLLLMVPFVNLAMLESFRERPLPPVSHAIQGNTLDLGLRHASVARPASFRRLQAQ